jgi:hypothetical protein
MSGLSASRLLRPDRRSTPGRRSGRSTFTRLRRRRWTALGRRGWATPTASALCQPSRLPEDGVVRAIFAVVAIDVEVLVTGDCPHLDAAVEVIAAAAERVDVVPRLRVVEILTLADARRHGFTGSPTIHVNGRDVDQAAAGEEPTALACRLYPTDHGWRGVPDIRGAASRQPVLTPTG